MNFEDLLFAGIFFLAAILVQITGVLIADGLNHKRTLQRLRIEHKNKVDYLASETFFKKKLEYFEKITKFIEDYTNYYSQLLFLLSNPQEVAKSVNLPDIAQLKNVKLIKQKISDILLKLKEDNFINLLPAGSSLYLKNGTIPIQISTYVLTHTRIFTLIAQDLKNKSEKNNQEILSLISQNIAIGNQLIEALKKDLLYKI
jgi:hypothetical protein